MRLQAKEGICCLIELEWLENTPWLHVLVHQESFQPPYAVNQISVASLVAVSLMQIQSLHYHEQLHCCLCAEVQPSWRYGVLLWPTFCSVSHNLTFIGILGVAKRDARQLLSCSHRCLTCDIGVWMCALSFSVTSMNMLGDREEWGCSCNLQMSHCMLMKSDTVMSYHSLHLARSSFNPAAVNPVIFSKPGTWLWEGMLTFFPHSWVSVSCTKLSVSIRDMALQFQFSPHFSTMKRNPTLLACID